MDLNVDCLFIIFQHLDVYDLLSVAEANEYLLFAVQAVSKHRFGRKKATIRIDFFGFSMNENKDEIQLFDIGQLELLKRNVLKYFGHSFAVLQVNIGISFEDITVVPRLFEQINLYCSESLTDLQLSILKPGNMVDAFKKPFQNVNNLTIFYELNQFDNSHLTFTEIFPALRYLTFHSFRAERCTWANQTFPHLEYLNTGMVNYSGISTDSFQELIRNNPQIRWLIVDMSFVKDGLKLLQFIAEHLPELERLEILGCGETNTDNIHFEHLKTLIVHSMGYTVPVNTTFGQLEELQTASAFGQTSDRWMTLVKNQQSLKKLSVNQFMKNSDILQIANANSNLVELTYKCGCRFARHNYGTQYNQIPECSCDVREESIVHLIESNEHLQLIHLYSGWAATNPVFNALRNQLPGWTITRNSTEDNGDHVCLERKQNP